VKITILGSGTSSGVPRIGGADGAGDWGLCDPSNPKNRRRRAALLVEHGDSTILIDTGPDLREQLLSARVTHLDAVFLTHDHADHAHGIDDLRQVFHAMGQPVGCFASSATWSILRQRFNYAFEGTQFYPPTCTATDLSGPVVVGDMLVTPFEQNHGNIDSTGFRIETRGHAVAYSTDVKTLDHRADHALAGLDLWVVDALRRHPHPTHSHLSQTLGWIETYKPARAILTHMDQSMDYAGLVAELPSCVEPGFDGLTIDLAQAIRNQA
jgi:phosphoribosyl 1,2-cyclic phosphate phosphodiesterase